MSALKSFILCVLCSFMIFIGCGGGFDGDDSEAAQIGESIFGSDSTLF